MPDDHHLHTQFVLFSPVHVHVNDTNCSASYNINASNALYAEAQTTCIACHFSRNTHTHKTYQSVQCVICDCIWFTDPFLGSLILSAIAMLSTCYVRKSDDFSHQFVFVLLGESFAHSRFALYFTLLLLVYIFQFIIHIIDWVNSDLATL